MCQCLTLKGTIPMQYEMIRVLILEDSALIALDMEDVLSDNGYFVVGPAMTVADALEKIETNNVDVAIVDLNLNGERSYQVADALRHRNIPFLFLSGYQASDTPERFRTVPFLTKPTSDYDMLLAVKNLTGELAKSRTQAVASFTAFF